MENLPPSLLIDEDAREGWVFLDYADDGRVLVMGLDQFEALYRPDPDDQG